MMLIADRYEPTGNASWGGMGEVNECTDNNLSRKVVLKRVHKASDMPRLLDEQKALLKLRSKHVIQLLDVVRFSWNGDEITCLVLEFIDGVDLSKLKFSPDHDFQKILWQIASGISDIHDAGVIHRDITPSNIRRDVHGVIKIFDFGLARETEKDDRTRSIIGTPGYMAPELFGSKTIPFSQAVDVFSFGTVALSLLGQQPSAGLPTKITSASVKKRFPQLDDESAKLIGGCLELAPSARPKMSEVASIIGRELLRDKHRARVVNGSNVQELHSQNRSINLQSAVGSLRIDYDGFKFVVTQVTGSVFINNSPVSVGDQMLSSCVITIGAAGANRGFVTFDVSNPEVMAA
jgi:serine/threonine protein kinase